MTARPNVIAAIATALTVGLLLVSTTASGFTTETTTTTTRPLQLVQPTTTRPSSAPVTSDTPPSTIPPVIVHPTTTRPGTTAPGVIVQPTVATTTTAATQPSAEVATTTAAEGELVQATTTTTEPQTSGEPVEIGELSTDPDDWSEDVVQHLQADGFDLDDLADHSATAADTPGALLSNEGCAVNCITSGLAWAVGVGAHLEVTTSVPAIIRIELLEASPQSKMMWTYEKLFGATWPDLEPNTTYDAVAYAIDADGNVAIASGEFTTLGRYAAITLTPTAFAPWNPTGPLESQVIHGFAYGWLDGDAVAIEGPPDLLELVYPKGAMTSSIVTVIYKGVVGGICPGLDWSISPIPDDVSGSIECGESGSGTQGDYGAVAAEIQLDGYPDDSTSWTGHEFTVPLSTFYGQPQEPPLYVAIEVTVHVWYE